MSKCTVRSVCVCELYTNLSSDNDDGPSLALVLAYTSTGFLARLINIAALMRRYDYLDTTTLFFSGIYGAYLFVYHPILRKRRT